MFRVDLIKYFTEVRLLTSNTNRYDFFKILFYIYEMIKVSILGAGNLGSHLFNNFIKIENIEVTQWYNRSLKSIEQHKNKVRITNKIEELTEADVYLLCLSDDILPTIATQLIALKGVIAHTAGSVSINILKGIKNHGVFYPLQTFSKSIPVPLNNIPICIEGNNNYSREILNSLAKHISHNIKLINTKQRLGLHTAAVFVNNFTNYMYQIGGEICEKQQVSFNMLMPLIKETARKIEIASPKKVQTGPALRNDQSTIQKHLSLLSNPAFKDLYLTLTDSIQKNNEQSKL